MNPADAFDDATLCPMCGQEMCEDPDHLPPPKPNGKVHGPAAPELTAEEQHARRLGSAVEAERVKREARRVLDAEERPPVVFPPFETLRERLARPVTATPWRIQRWQPRGSRVMMAAQFKAGKSTLRDNYIRSKVDGDLFLGRDSVAPITGTLVLIDLEMSEPLLDGWLRDQGIRDDDRVIPIPLRGKAASFNILDADVRREWAERLKAHHAEDLVIDCVRPILDALGLDEQREGGRFLVALDALLSEADIPEALVVQHMGHQGERARGDSRFRDWPDVEWRLVRRDEDPASARYITAYGRDVEIPESRLIYDPASRHLTIEDGSRRDAAGHDALSDVLDVLREATEPLSGRAVKKALQDSDHARGAIETAIRIGVRERTVTKVNGKHRAQLYSLSVPVSSVSRSVPPRVWDTP